MKLNARKTVHLTAAFLAALFVTKDYIPSLAGFDDQNLNWHPPGEGQDAGRT